MFFIRRHIKIFTRACLVLVYVSFFLVQLNVHFGKTPVLSYFTGDFISRQSGKSVHSVAGKNQHSDSKTTRFRLNKRFHPSYLFIAADCVQDLVLYSFSIRVNLLNETQPITSFSFNSPSLRGPPTVV